MRNQLGMAMGIVWMLAGCAPAPTPKAPTARIERWAAYYNTKLPAAAFAGQDLVVFDRRYYPAFKPLQPRTQVLAYVSIGEIYDDVPEKTTLEKEKALLTQHDRWKSYGVDLTSKTWRKMVLGYVHDAEKKGFDGVMLDGIEAPLAWAQTQEPTRYDAMRQSAIMLVNEIHSAHPRMKLMLNRGLELLPELASKIDYVLAESILSNGNVSTGHFDLFSPRTYAQAVTQLHHVESFAPHLQILTLDYWNQDDVHGLERIYATQRASGFVPYITTPDLRHFTPEPLRAAPLIEDAAASRRLRGSGDA